MATTARLFTNATLRTPDPAPPGHDSVAVLDGEIAAVGDRATAEAALPEVHEVVDVGGRTLAPGFIDAHVHPLPMCFFEHNEDLGECTSLEEVFDRLSDRAAREPTDGWVVGMQIDDELLAERRLPTRAELDRVDVLTWGATKNGAMYGEAVVLLRPELAPHARFVRKQAGQLPSKARFVAAQMLALLDGDRWLEHAEHANAMAHLLADRVRDVQGVRLAREPEANAVFVHLPHDAIAPLREWSFFWDWDEAEGLVRWMTHFATRPEDVERFVAGVEAFVGQR